MKRKTYILTIAAAFVFMMMGMSVSGSAKSKMPLSIIIEGEISDSVLSLTPEKEVKIILYISQFPSSGYTAPSETYTKEVRNNEKFRFEIPTSNTYMYMRLAYETANWNNIFQNPDNVYILKQGDRIYCKLSDKNFSFSGRGSERLNCQSELYSIQYPANGDGSPYDESDGWDKYMAYDSDKRDSVLQLRTKVVQKYAPHLGEEMTKIMLANCYGLRYNILYRAQNLYLSQPLKIQAFFKSANFKELDDSLVRDLAPHILVTAPNYCDFLFLKILLSTWKVEEGKIKSQANSQSLVYNVIVADYQGLIRDNLLVLFFRNYKNSPGTLDFLNDALSMVHDPVCRTLLTKIKSTKSAGLDFYPFEMEDDKGKTVRLADFKDSILIIDFWYTGCVNCAKLTTLIEPVVNRFKNDPRVKFISVSIDPTKDKWVKSIASMKYTHKESINLYAGGKSVNTADQHPLIKNYGITSYPTMFIVKNGKMFESVPPMFYPDRLTAVIEQALKK